MNQYEYEQRQMDLLQAIDKAQRRLIVAERFSTKRTIAARRSDLDRAERAYDSFMERAGETS